MEENWNQNMKKGLEYLFRVILTAFASELSLIIGAKIPRRSSGDIECTNAGGVDLPLAWKNSPRQRLPTPF